MWPFTRRKQEEFNAVVEGTFHDEWRCSHYKLVDLEIPEGTVVIDDGQYRYKLYGVTEDFERLVKVKEKEGLETKVTCLGMGPGVVVSSNPNPILERPRMIFMKDGRVFFDESLARVYSDDEPYIVAVPGMLDVVDGIFGSEDSKEFYNSWIN